MTTFRGPLHIGSRIGVPAEGASRYVTIEQSGTTQLYGAAQLEVRASASGGNLYAIVEASGTTRFAAPVRDMDATGTVFGTHQLVAFVTVTGTLAALASQIRLPVGAIVYDAQAQVLVNVDVSSSGAAEWFIAVGTSADEDFYLRIPVSATGVSRMGLVSAASMLNVAAAGSQIHLTVNVQTTLSSKDLTSINAVLLVHYARRV